MAIAPPGIMSTFQVESKGKGKRVRVFLLKKFASYSGKKAFLKDLYLHLIGQNCFSWLPPVVRVVREIEYFVSDSTTEEGKRRR